MSSTNELVSAVSCTTRRIRRAWKWWSRTPSTGEWIGVGTAMAAMIMRFSDLARLIASGGAKGETVEDQLDRWRRRPLPEDVRQRYHDEGWWTDDTLGSMVADGLGRLGPTPFRVRSQVHPWDGTFA